MTGRLLMIAAATVLWVAVLGAALAVVHSRHEARRLFAELQQLEQERDELDIDWGRLRLEQSAHATHGLIESVARDELKMAVPAADEIVIVREP